LNEPFDCEEKKSIMTTGMASTGADTSIRPFRVDISDKLVDDMRRQIGETRWPEKELDPSQGVQLATMQALARYWANEHDWQKTQAKLNALPQFLTTIDGLDIHFIHVKSEHENALPLLITHGWPGSVIEMLGVIGPLTDPTAHGGKAEDAFDVVIPSIPGFGFSGKPTAVGWDPPHCAQAWGQLMTRLGYTRYVAQGGDAGAGITDAMAHQGPEGLAGIHLNFLASLPPDVLASVFGGEIPSLGFFKRVVVALVGEHAEKKEPTALDAFRALTKRGYIVEMPEHPQTIGYSLADTPIGMAAWMLDHDADSYAKISDAFLNNKPSGGLTKENIVDNLSMYWLTNTSTSAARAYWENGRAIAASVSSGKKPPKLKLPVAFTVFPGEIYQAPKRWAEKVYPNLVYFNTAERGGHFAAWEEPELFAQEMRAGFQSLR
jgi:pimeloyl-ACP methyl ester carboxylesterase